MSIKNVGLAAFKLQQFQWFQVFTFEMTYIWFILLNQRFTNIYEKK